jgi:MYXO-CTERM domain-containing protein
VLEDDDEDEGGGRPHKRGWRSLLHGLLGSGGCSVNGQATEGNLAWFALLSGMLVLRTRRRR